MLLEILNLIGVIACAVTGALAAGRVKMDWFGVIMISMVTALGGGSVRDVLLMNYPLPWVKDSYLLFVVAGCSFVTIWAARYMYYLKTIFLVLDAIGMVAFTLLGAQAALSLGHGLTIACVAGVCTGSFGGVIRDILCNRIPLAFKAELYASIAFLTSVVYWLLLKVGVGVNTAVICCLVFGISFRLLAIRFNLSLPVFDYDEERYQHVNWLDRSLEKLRFRDRRRAASNVSINQVQAAPADYSDPQRNSFQNGFAQEPEAVQVNVSTAEAGEVRIEVERENAPRVVVAVDAEDPSKVVVHTTAEEVTTSVADLHYTPEDLTDSSLSTTLEQNTIDPTANAEEVILPTTSVKDSSQVEK